jgi:thymidine phosphorylase
MTMNVVDVIRTKRDGGTLSDDQVQWFIDAYTKGGVADEQASALLMAVFFRGMAPDELATWTAAMIASGERLDLSTVGRPTVDKHSTGGVGDRSCPSWPHAARPCRSSRAAGWVTPGAPSTSSRPSPGFGWRSAMTRSSTSCAPWAP